MAQAEQPLEAGVAPAKAEDSSDAAGSLHTLIDATDSYASSKRSFDIVAVHGVGGLGEKSWASTKHPTWIHDLAAQHQWEVRVIRYRYNVGKITEAAYPDDAVSAEALRLLQKLAELRSEQQPPLPLAFFAHDLGGIIVKKALILASRSSNAYSDIRCLTRLLMFFGCPHRTAGGYHDMDTLGARLRLLVEADSQANGGSMRGLARSITAVNHSFLQTRMLTRANIINVISDKKDPKERIFDKHTASFGISLEKVVLIDKPHKELGQEPAGDSWQTVYGGYKFDRVASFPWLTDKLSRFIETVEFQAAPIYPLRSTSAANHSFDWLDKDVVFQAWRKSRGTNLLHIYGTLGTSDAAEYAFREIAQDNDVSSFRSILYFRFDKRDVRRNSIGAMAKTFLVQILTQIRVSPARLLSDLEPPDFSDCWADRDAFFFLDKIRRDLGRHGRVHWVLDGLDQCDESSRWFLSEVLSIAKVSEQDFKILITSVDSSHICEALSKFPAIDLRQHVSETDSVEEAKLEFLTALYQERPQFHYVEPKIRNLLDACGDDSLLRRLLFEWLLVSPCVSTSSALEQELASLASLSPAIIFEKALDTVAEEQRPWARKVIRWMLRSARPMSPEELASALTLEAPVDSSAGSGTCQDLVWDIRQCFGLLIVIENGLVKFLHPAAQNVFAFGNVPVDNKDRRWYTLSSPEEDHREITDACLRYLSLPGVQEEILSTCRATSHAQPIFECPSDILSYAIRYWPWHYQLGYSTGSSIPWTSNVTAFFHDKKALQCWAAANWHFSNPHIRPDRSFLTPLPILATIGLENSVASLIKSSTLEDEYSISTALTEASRHGKKKVVKMMLEKSSVDKSRCLEAIMAAARSGEFEVIRMLLNYATEKLQGVQWPGFLTSRLAYLGLVDELKTTLQAGTNMSSTDADYSPPLHCAIVSNNTRALDALIEHGADPAAINPNWKDTPSILVAAKHGRAHMVSRLAKASVDSCDSRGRTALWVAAVTGQHATLQSLLDAGADKRVLEAPMRGVMMPMWTMAYASFLKCLELALKHGANPNCKLSKGHPSSPLSAAALRGWPDICRTLLENGAHIESDNDPPLVHAVRSGNHEVVEVFLEKGAKLDVKLEYDQYRGTPLIAAAEGNYHDIAKLLIGRGASIDYAISTGGRALHYAVGKDRAQMVKLLIDSGADIKAANTAGWSALHNCYQDAGCMKVLLDAGADVNSASPDGTPLYLAAYHGKLDVVKLILSYHPDVDTSCPEGDFWDVGYTSLHMAACDGSTEMLRLLIEAGANINSKTPKAGTPLILAVFNKNEECVKVLLEYDVDLDAVDNSGDTALHCLESPASLSIAKLLINRGSSLKVRNKLGRNILDSAVENKDVPFVEFLLDKKADVNSAVNFYGAALHRAASNGDVEMVKLLVRKGADVHLTHPWMYGTPLQEVFKWSPTAERKDAVARYLINEAGANVNIHGGMLGSALSAGLLRGSLDTVKFLLKEDADVGWADLLGRRPVHLAALRTREYLQLLLDSDSADDAEDGCGLGVATKTKLGQTVLHFAAATGHTDLVELVLSHTQGQIHMNEPDEDGWTPLLWACRPCDAFGNPDSVKPSMVKFLLDHGADPWAQGRTWDGKLWSPLKMARYHGADDEVVELLTSKRDEGWNPEFHLSKKGERVYQGYCDGCLFGMRGIRHMCLDCDKNLGFCFKCARWKEELHPYHNNWELEGAEFEQGEEDEAKPESPKGSPDIEQVEDDDSVGDWSNDEDAKEDDK